MGFLGDLGEESNGLVHRCAKDIFTLVDSIKKKEELENNNQNDSQDLEHVEEIKVVDLSHAESILKDLQEELQTENGSQNDEEILNSDGIDEFSVNKSSFIENKDSIEFKEQKDQKHLKNINKVMEHKETTSTKFNKKIDKANKSNKTVNKSNKDIDYVINSPASQTNQQLNNSEDTIQLDENQEDIRIYIDFVQIYLEKIQDLLNPVDSNLAILEGKDGSISIPNLTRIEVKSVEDILYNLSIGLENRIVAPTLMNTTSSRSHTILSIHVKRIQKHKTIESTLRICDLAGSERTDRSGSSGLRLDEAKCINKSLSTLGLVISSLAEKKSRSHIPFRDSKLTRLLKPVLGSGNSNTILIITASPSELCFSDTLSTLQFGQRCMYVEMNAILNEKEEIDYKDLSIKLQARIRELESLLYLNDSIPKSNVDKNTIHDIQESNIQYNESNESNPELSIDNNNMNQNDEASTKLAWGMCNALHDSLYKIYSVSRDTIDEMQIRSQQMEDLWTPKNRLDENANLTDLRLRRIAIVNETLDQIRTEFPMILPFQKITSKRIVQLHHSETSLDTFTQHISNIYHSTFSYINNLRLTLREKDEQIEKMKRELAKHIVDQINDTVNGTLSQLNNKPTEI